MDQKRGLGEDWVRRPNRRDTQVSSTRSTFWPKLCVLAVFKTQTDFFLSISNQNQTKHNPTFPHFLSNVYEHSDECSY